MAEAATAEARRKQNLIAARRPGQSPFAPVAIGKHGIVSSQVDDVHRAPVIPLARMLKVRDAIAPRRNAHVAHVAADLAEHMANGILQAILSRDFANDGELRAVGRPVRLPYTFLNFARSAPVQRHTRQCTDKEPVPDVPRAGENREFPLGRHGEQLHAGRAERLGLGIVGAHREDLRCVAPGRGSCRRRSLCPPAKAA